MSEASVEAEIVAKGLTAPRLTPEYIDSQIACENYGRASDLWRDAPHHPSLACLTICVLTMKNGFTIIGKSACASPENFDMELGIKIAREDARRQIWALEGYQLRSFLADHPVTTIHPDGRIEGERPLTMGQSLGG